MYWFLCFIVFLVGYLINSFYITVLYHRGLAHGAVKLRPWVRNLVIYSGNWVTGLDPKAWACMHRRHHLYSDTPDDPHSPVYQGVMPLLYGQLKSYKKTLRGLITRQKSYVSFVQDLDFPVNALNRQGLWYVPYIVHALISLTVGLGMGYWALGIAYWFGIMSHPIQGWMVNALAHRFGYRNFATNDNSRNNTLVALLVWGEGYQNNHHHAPTSVKFAAKWWEIDLGYQMCKVARWFRMLDFRSVGYSAAAGLRS
jgi:stearoyl-CoA desaturase (Delta-9 desaturase)